MLAAGAVFFFSLALRLAYPHSLLAEGFQFCAEAALVGGIADWFAVTALFRKPWGISYHTAILPRRRDAFIKASVTMVQKEFFSRRKIILHLEKLHVLPMLMTWLREASTQEQMLHRLMHFLRDFLLAQNEETQKKLLTERLRRSLEQLPAKELISKCGQWLSAKGRDREALAHIARHLRAHAAAPETKQAIVRVLTDYEQEKVQGPWSLFMVGLAEAMDLVNIEDAAAAMQEQAIKLLDEVATENSPLQQELMAVLHEQAKALNDREEMARLWEELKQELIDELPLDKGVGQAIDYLRQEFTPKADGHSDTVELTKLRASLWEILADEYQRCLALVDSDAELKKSVERFLYDLVARSALHAQSLIGVIVKNVLQRLTDEELNRLVYDKVEPDLLWIRMNGSIVGSGVGLLLFLGITLMKL